MKLGVCYYPEHWPESQWQQDAEKMVELGISVVRIGEFAWSRFEPKKGEYRWQWFHNAIETLSRQGLKLVLGTPTATPPNWLVQLHPEMLAKSEDGHVRKFGSRRHYCFSSKIYQDYSRQIVEKMTAEYGEIPDVIAWQTDNEYGCHSTIRSYSEAAKVAFSSLVQKSL